MEKQDNTDPNANQSPQQEELPEVQHELSKVAANPKQSILILVVVIFVFGYLFFYFFISKKSDDPNEAKIEIPTEIAKPAQTIVSDVPAIPQLPEPPKLVDPELPPAPSPETPTKNPDIIPPPPVTVTPEAPPPIPAEPILQSKIVESEDIRKRKELKRKSSIVLLAGIPPKKTQEQLEEEADFKSRGNLELLLGRGKIIDAVIESAINTDFGGELRAIVSRDIFSESGKIILIPKGSRIFGTYNVGINGPYGRVSVDWNRVDLTSGYSVNIIGPGVDNLSKKGFEGRVDNKFKERLSNSVLMSAFNIAFATQLDKIVPPPQSSQAATENIAAASNLNNIALSIYNDNTKNEATKIELICSSVQAAIPDKTSTAFKTFTTACFNLRTLPVGTTPVQNLTSLMSIVNAAATSLLTTTTTQVTPTQAQNASKQAFIDVSDTIKQILSQQNFTPTITIPQGTPVKIYVTKDYKFPKAAINKLRVMK